MKRKKKKALQDFTMSRPVFESGVLINKHQAQNIKNQYVSQYSKMDLKTVEKHQPLEISPVFVNMCPKNTIGIRWPSTFSNVDMWRRTKKQPVKHADGSR